jgi:hypothetical protein
LWVKLRHQHVAQWAGTGERLTYVCEMGIDIGVDFIIDLTRSFLGLQIPEDGQIDCDAAERPSLSAERLNGDCPDPPTPKPATTSRCQSHHDGWCAGP